MNNSAADTSHLSGEVRGEEGTVNLSTPHNTTSCDILGLEGLLGAAEYLLTDATLSNMTCRYSNMTCRYSNFINKVLFGTSLI